MNAQASRRTVQADLAAAALARLASVREPSGDRPAAERPPKPLCRWAGGDEMTKFPGQKEMRKNGPKSAATEATIGTYGYAMAVNFVRHWANFVPPGPARPRGPDGGWPAFLPGLPPSPDASARRRKVGVL